MATPVATIAPGTGGGTTAVTREPSSAARPRPAIPRGGAPSIATVPFRPSTPSSLTAFEVAYLPASAGVSAVGPSHLRLIPVTSVLAATGYLRDEGAGAKEVGGSAEGKTARPGAGTPTGVLLPS